MSDAEYRDETPGFLSICGPSAKHSEKTSLHCLLAELKPMAAALLWKEISSHFTGDTEPFCVVLWYLTPSVPVELSLCCLGGLEKTASKGTINNLLRVCQMKWFKSTKCPAHIFKLKITSSHILSFCLYICTDGQRTEYSLISLSHGEMVDLHIYKVPQ